MLFIILCCNCNQFVSTLYCRQVSGTYPRVSVPAVEHPAANPRCSEARSPSARCVSSVGLASLLDTAPGPEEENNKSYVGKIVKKQRPVNLDLPTIRFPVTAIASILHRVSGVAVFIAIGILLWLLGLSLSSADGFAQAAALLDSALARLVLWGILTALAYHICGGIRHLLMDFGYLEESFSVGCRSAQLTFAATVLLSVCAGVLVW